MDVYSWIIISTHLEAQEAEDLARVRMQIVRVRSSLFRERMFSVKDQMRCY